MDIRNFLHSFNHQKYIWKSSKKVIPQVITVPSEDCCSIAFAQDLAYWEISETSLETCCLKRFSEVKDNLDWTLQGGAFTDEEDKFPASR